MSGVDTSAVAHVELMDRLRAVVRALRWDPPDAGPNDTNITMFGPDKRFVEATPSITPRVAERLRTEYGGSPREYVAEMLKDTRPIGYGIEHEAVSLLQEDSHRELAELLDCYPVERHVIARRMRGALAEDLERRAQQSVSEPVLRALREAFRLAELCWALGLESARTSSGIPVVNAAAEACSTIGGALLELSPASDEMLDDDLLHRIHHARMAWIGILLRFDAHADLVADGGQRLNARLVRLIGRGDDPRRGPVRSFLHIFSEDPAPLVGPRLRRLAEADALEGESARRLRSTEWIAKEEEHRFLDVAARLLLPRYLIDEAVGLLQHLGTRDSRPSRPPGRRLRRPSELALPLIPAAIAGVLLVVSSLALMLREIVELLSPGGLAAAASSLDRVLPGSTSALSSVVGGVRMLIIGLAVAWLVLSAHALVRRGRSASYLLLLRVPAVTAFGLAILSGVSLDWIGTESWLARVGPIVALLAAFAYSVVEFINQGGDSRGTFRPAFVLTIIAGGMALMVTTLVLPLVRLETVTILAAVSLALGTFLQAIWDEQPITAPLSYLRLRG